MTINEPYILHKIKKYTDSSNIVVEDTFNSIFNNIPEDQYKEIIGVCSKNQIVIQKECLTEQVHKKRRPANYRKNLRNLSNEQLCILSQRGDEYALEALCENNRGFLYKICYKYKNAYRNKFSIVDLMGYGYLGFIEAVKRFDTSSEFKLISYAVHYIKQSILANIAYSGFSVKIPLNIMDDLRAILKLQKMKPNISQVEIEQHFENMNYSENKIALTLDLFSNVLHHKSIFEPVEGSDEVCQVDLIRCEQPSVEEDLSKSEFDKFVMDILMTLSKRDRFIIEHRFGLNGEEKHNLEEIGTMLGLTRERVRQISDKVLASLKTKMKSKLKHYEYN